VRNGLRGSAECGSCVGGVGRIYKGSANHILKVWCCSAKRLHRVRDCFVNDLAKALLIFDWGAVNFPFSFLQNSPGDKVAA